MNLRGLLVLLVPAAILAGGCETMGMMDSIEGQRWELVEIGGVRAIAPIGAERAHIFLDLGPPLRAHGVLGCNRFAASYMLLGDRLTFGPAMATRMACPEGMAQEAAFGQALEVTRAWRLVAGRLELLDADGGTVAIFDAGPRG